MSKLFLLAFAISLAVLSTSANEEISSAAAIELQNCADNFNSDFSAASGDSQSECAAYESLNKCVQAAFTQVTMSEPLGALRLANDIITEAVSRQTVCDISQLGFIAKSSDSHSHHRNSRAIITIYELADRLKALDAVRASLDQDTSDKFAQIVQVMSQFGSVVSSVVTTLFNNHAQAFNARLTSTAGVIVAATTTLPSLPLAVSDVQNYANNLLTLESNARVAAKNNIDASIASLSTTISSGLSAAVADRSNMRATAASFANAGYSSIQAQLVIETTRETSDTATRSTTLASTRSTRAAAVSTSMSSELSRFVVSCPLKVASAQFAFPVDSVGANDDMPCTGDDLSTSYYSANSGTIYVCNGRYYIPLIMDLGRSGFVGNTILNSYQSSQLENTLGTNAIWVKCFTATTDGYNGATFHNNCNGKGPNQLVVIKETGTNRVFGGFTDIGFTNQNNGWRNAIGAFTFRFNPSNYQLDMLYPYQYTSYNIYDNNSYGPNFGYGGGNMDIQIPSSMTTSYAGMSGFWTYYSYQLSFPPCTGCGSTGLYTSVVSFSLANLEAYYRAN